MSVFSSLLTVLSSQPAIHAQMVAPEPPAAMAALAMPLDAACAAFIDAGGADTPELRAQMAAAFGAAACPTLLARVIPVSGKGRARRRRRAKLANQTARAMRGIAGR